MSNFHSLKFTLWDSVGTIVQLIHSWNPSGCKSEKDYEGSLYNYLRSALPGVIITPQFAYGRARTDLAIQNRVAVEIKKDLNDTSEFQRLLGQILQFKEWDGNFIVLLLGSTDPNLLDELRRHTRDTQTLIIGSPKVVVVEKQL